jgi:hypothetical protein
MRTFSIFAMLAIVAGCSSEQGFAGAGSDPVSEEVDGTEPPVGASTQKAQFADDTVINLLEPGYNSTIVTVTADNDPVNINVFYLGDKTTNAGRTPAAPQLVQSISLAADQTRSHTVNMYHPAFNGGYGSMVIQAVDEAGEDTFQTYVQYGGSIFSTGGSVFTGGSYRIPYLSGTLRVALVLTNQGDFTFDVTINNVNGIQQRTISLAPLSTYKFDSSNENWTLSGTGSIQVTTSNSGVLAVSGFVDRLFNRSRITPVKAAPFP